MSAEPRPGRGRAPPLLDRILSRDNLAAAWEEVAANAGVPGVDGVSVRRYARTWEELVVALAEGVRAERYRPAPLRVLHIPKPDGGERTIGVPTVDDRVLQRATLQVLLPIFDRRFLKCSYGYRPGLGVAQAVASVIHYRERGLRYVLEADVDDCFASLDHTVLVGLVERVVPDADVLHLVRTWMTVGAADPDGARGVALGMPISPLLANIYLHELDWRLVKRRWPLVRYADDFVVPVASEWHAGVVLSDVTTALAEVRLRLEPTKTRVASFADGFEFLGVRFRGDTYSFVHRAKRVTVQGRFAWLWGRHMTWGYR